MSLWINCAEWKAELFVKSLTLNSQKHGTILGTDDKDWEEVISNGHHSSTLLIRPVVLSMAMVLFSSPKLKTKVLSGSAGHEEWPSG